ncbi:MAG: hypothetical protein QOF51_2388 [Chloroflexota bacterium]|jgi:hypothetical protein|nr:hypothetical protein [Chloroflexota bacterium]
MRVRLPIHHLNLIIVAALLLPFAMPFLQMAQAQGQCNPLITIDAPPANATVQGQTTFAGWAVDLSTPDGSGISSVQIVADNLLSAGGTVLGTATQVARPDVAAALGRAGSFGFNLVADLSNMTPGPHTFYVYATTSCGPAYASVIANVQPAYFHVDSPASGASISNGQTVDVGGWSAGTRVDVYLDGPAGQGQGIGSAPVNLPRPDVAQVTGKAELANSGFDIVWQVSGLANGSHTLYVYSLINGNWALFAVPVTVSGGQTGASAGTTVAAAPTSTTNSTASCNPNFPASSSSSQINVPCTTSTTGLSGSCNPSFPNASYQYPSNTPCTGANAQNCNPFYPNQNSLYPTNVPCSTTVSTGFNGNCNPFYPTASTLYPNNVPCTGTTTSCNPFYPTATSSFPNNVPCGAGYTNCNPFYPTASTSFPTNVPCTGTTSINCNPFFPNQNSSYPNNLPCTGTANVSNCNPNFPTPNPVFPTNVQCTTGTTPGPSAVTAAATRPLTITINWNAVAGATSYTVFQSPTGPGGPYNVYVSQVPSQMSTTQVSGLTPGTTYFYGVAANGPWGVSTVTPAQGATAF